MKSFLTMDDADFFCKRVLVRVDLNVPVQDGEVTDLTRIERIIPTLKELVKANAKVVIISHFGRPPFHERGKWEASYSLKFLAPILEKLLGVHVAFASDCIGPKVAAQVDSLSIGQVILLENLRFYKEEEENDEAFANELAGSGDIYINDAFSCSHRAHASIVGIPKFAKISMVGRSMQAELEALERTLTTPERPLVAVIGGSKISTKLDLLMNLMDKVDSLVIGGAMANTFFAAQGFPVGKSLCEFDMKETALKILTKAEKSKCQIILPEDVVVAEKMTPKAAIRVIGKEQVLETDMILDIGPKTVSSLENVLKTAKTLLWNGPLGVSEMPPFDVGTVEVAKTAARFTVEGSLVSVAGGGDTLAALAHAGVKDQFSYVSTAGGAFLEWLEGKTLPGVQVLIREN